MGSEGRREVARGEVRFDGREERHRDNGVTVIFVSSLKAL